MNSLKIFGGQLNLTDYPTTIEPTIHDLRIVLLTVNGNLYHWHESDRTFRRCVYDVNRTIAARDVHVNKDELLMVTRDGEAFRAKISSKRERTTSSVRRSGGNVKKKETAEFNKFLDRDDYVHVKLTKIANVHRAVSISSDPNAGNYAVVQVTLQLE